MDELKLIKWKEQFEEKVKALQIEYDAFFLHKPMEDVYTIRIGVNSDLVLLLNTELPGEIKTRFEQIFLAAKPEDSI